MAPRAHRQRELAPIDPSASTAGVRARSPPHICRLTPRHRGPTSSPEPASGGPGNKPLARSDAPQPLSSPAAGLFVGAKRTGHRVGLDAPTRMASVPTSCPFWRGARCAGDYLSDVIL